MTKVVEGRTRSSNNLSRSSKVLSIVIRRVPFANLIPPALRMNHNQWVYIRWINCDNTPVVTQRCLYIELDLQP